MHVICASSDYEQLAAICDRVIVFGRGRVCRELVGDDLTKERIVEQCYAAHGRRGWPGVRRVSDDDRAHGRRPRGRVASARVAGSPTCSSATRCSSSGSR